MHNDGTCSCPSVHCGSLCLSHRPPFTLLVCALLSTAFCAQCVVLSLCVCCCPCVLMCLHLYVCCARVQGKPTCHIHPHSRGSGTEGSGSGSGSGAVGGGGTQQSNRATTLSRPLSSVVRGAPDPEQLTGEFHYQVEELRRYREAPTVTDFLHTFGNNSQKRFNVHVQAGEALLFCCGNTGVEPRVLFLLFVFSTLRAHLLQLSASV